MVIIVLLLSKFLLSRVIPKDNSKCNQTKHYLLNHFRISFVCVFVDIITFQPNKRERSFLKQRLFVFVHLMVPGDSLGSVLRDSESNFLLLLVEYSEIIFKKVKAKDPTSEGIVRHYF